MEDREFWDDILSATDARFKPRAATFTSALEASKSAYHTDHSLFQFVYQKLHLYRLEVELC